MQLPRPSSKTRIASLPRRPLVTATLRHVRGPVRLLVAEHEHCSEQLPIASGGCDHLGRDGLETRCAFGSGLSAIAVGRVGRESDE
jgi:hypothetical protein